MKISSIIESSMVLAIRHVQHIRTDEEAEERHDHTAEKPTRQQSSSAGHDSKHYR